MPNVTNEQLDRLLSALDTHHAPVSERLNPGLTDTEIERHCERVGIDLPDEPRTWWKWRNGASFAEGDIDSTDLLAVGPGNLLLPIEMAVEECLVRREMAAALKPEEPEYWWKPSWLPFSKEEYAFECEVPRGEPCPIRDTDPMSNPYSPGTPVASSFGELVDIWIFALSEGIWSWDPSLGTAGGWNQDTTNVPPGLMKLSLF